MSSMKNKKILVTGAAGFIGSHLTEKLVKSGAKVRTLVRYTSSGNLGLLENLPKSILDKTDIVRGDIGDPDICKKAVENIDYILHLAAQIAIPYSYIAPRDFLRVNALGTTNLLSASKEKNIIRFLQISSSEVYGSAQYIPMDEKHPLNPQSPYAASKVAADKMTDAFHLSYNIPITIARPFNIYGPRQSARAVIPAIILQALRGKTIKLGITSTQRDLNYVGDIVNGMINAAFSNDTIGKTINLASSKSYSIKEIVDLTGQILGKKLIVKTEKRRLRPKKSEVNILTGDARLAKELINYKSSTNITKGLEKTIKYFKSNLHLYKKEDYQI